EESLFNRVNRPTQLSERERGAIGQASKKLLICLTLARHLLGTALGCFCCLVVDLADCSCDSSNCLCWSNSSIGCCSIQLPQSLLVLSDFDFKRAHGSFARQASETRQDDVKVLLYGIGVHRRLQTIELLFGL